MIQASDIKKLREATSAGFLDCKKALELSDGDYDKAYLYIREQGKTKADKKSERVACNGVVLAMHTAKGAALVEVNCETDFVSRNEDFQKFANDVLHIVFDKEISDVSEVSQALYQDTTVEHARTELVMTIGENILIRRCVFVASSDKKCVSYQHGQRIGVIVLMQSSDLSFCEEMAMQIAASNPMALHPSDIDPEILKQERHIAEARVQQMNKPENIAKSIVEGMVAKFIDSNTLGGQEFIMDNSLKVSEVLKRNKAEVEFFVRYELGEGIEVVKENFADAVQAVIDKEARN